MPVHSKSPRGSPRSNRQTANALSEFGFVEKTAHDEEHRFQQGKQQNAPASEKNLHVRPQGRKGIHQSPRGKSK